MELRWNSPDTVPDVPKWTEQEFWIAVASKYTGKTHVFLAQYQNRPLENDPISDDCLVDCDGEYIHSVGWVSCQTHVQYDNYYEAMDFSDHWKLLGWAEYTPPEFTGVTPNRCNRGGVQPSRAAN